MAPGPAPQRWVRYSHHRGATVDEWDRGITVRQTQKIGGRTQDSKYNPHFFHTDEQIQAIELRCITDGVVIRDSGHRVTKYLHIRGVIVGACCGVETEYIFAECTSGDYHGRPISIEALRDLGVNI